MSAQAGYVSLGRSGLVTAALSALTGERQDMPARALVWCLVPLAVLYSMGLKAYLSLYAIGVRRRRRLASCVVSVGNIVSGGTGKTALTVSLAGGLRERGVRVAILSRGYKGGCRAQVLVVSTYDSICAGAADAGDEPFLMATLLPGVPVLVGRDRRKTGAEAIRRFGPDVLLLDDGMQFYQLHRDLEIVLVSGVRPFGNGWTLPAGVLREPPSHLSRASFVVVSGADARDAERRLGSLGLKAPILRAAYNPTHIEVAGAGERLNVSVLAGTPVASFCALGAPVAFEATVESLGARIVRRHRLPDHACLSAEQLSRIAADAAGLEARALVTSAKDAVKLPPARLPLPIWVLHAEYKLDGMDELLNQVYGAVSLRSRRGAE